MDLQEDRIVDISPARERYFGCSGKMLLPSPATVAAQIKQIPEHHLVTLDLLQKKLAEQFQVEVTCPVTTRKALHALAQDTSQQVACWRVVRKHGELFAHFPGGAEGHAALLRKEGFTIDTSGKAPRVQQFKESVAPS